MNHRAETSNHLAEHCTRRSEDVKVAEDLSVSMKDTLQPTDRFNVCHAGALRAIC